ncbi:MAG: DUF2490 domain-containing protein [Bryobacteraceae bacterium]|nr:DUF2490 domain-containing protein [Bryobacterales bacterium]MEB2361019.1 DUF2490 domain-containing protein [Bryobacterales bacterium]NUM99583.1 DUF2490 domain-containing protein [Bryobacteraceae bacterium]
MPLYARSPARVSDINAQAWFGYNGDHALSSRWGIHFDTQVRRHPFITKWQQYAVRPGVNFQLNGLIRLSAGYLFSKSYPYGSHPARRAASLEHRTYEQLEIRHMAGDLKWGHRFRLEQRFAENGITYNGEEQAIDWIYRNRVRYRLHLQIPLTGETWYVPLSNEIFINFGANSPRAFNQNRAYAGIGHKLSETASLEVGYIYQTQLQNSGRVMEHNNTIIIRFSSSFPFRRSN